MSYKAMDSKGAMRQRRRPVMAVTISSGLLMELDELARRINLPRAKIVERCILNGLPVLRKQVESLEKKESVSVSKSESEDRDKPKSELLAERFMRRKLFNYDDEEGWAPYL